MRLSRMVWFAGAIVSLACGSNEGEIRPEQIEKSKDDLVGGRLALESEFPATVLLGGCTGVKVGARKFLLAAHCVHDTINNVVGLPPGSGITVNANNDSSLPGEFLTVQQTVIHPQWLSSCVPDCGVNVLNPTYPADVAVITVNELTPQIPKASVHATAVAVGSPVVIMGYGCEGPGEGPGGRLKLQNLTTLAGSALLHPGTYVPNAQAAADVAASYVITPGFFTSSSNATLCPGDSGGPLYRNNASEQLVVGVNAYYTFSDVPGGVGSVTNWHTRLDPARYGVLSWLQAQGVTVRTTGTCTDGVKNGAETGIDCGGSCTAHCANGQSCEAPVDCQSGSCVSGVCQAVTTPCGGLCASPTLMTTKPYQSGNLGSGATCHETTLNLTTALCGSFNSRTFSINGVQTSCSNVVLPPKRAGGYCFQASAGEPSWAWFSAW